MPPSGRTSAAPKSPREAAARVAAVLTAEGFVAFFAGGCVRDRLLGLEPADYDIATDARPEEIARHFPGARGVGASFGVMLVRSMGHTIEVATFRRDGDYLDGRRPARVEFGTAEQDARRRDFTINGLFEVPSDGRVIDFVGGVEDLRARRLRAIGRAEDRLGEDRLRMLRAARFAARFDLEVDSEVETAIRLHANDLLGVSRERVGTEVRRILLHPSRGRGVALIEALGLGPSVLRESPLPLTDQRIARLPPMCDLAAGLAAWMLDRSGASTGCGPDRQAQWGAALVLSNAEAEALSVTLELASFIRSGWEDADLAPRKRAAARSAFHSALDLIGAEDPVRAELVATEVERLAAEGLAPAPLVTGDDLIALGWAPGPAFKRVLSDLYDRQLRGEFSSRSAAIAAAREVHSADRSADPSPEDGTGTT
ncbi:MAG: CCA tRNA nucleotidyltransferase [Phycisphaeraceae bacterium]|nr:CCA tRNA nucleotidyltransferase [Phycisphaeraceae bacterium]